MPIFCEVFMKVSEEKFLLICQVLVCTFAGASLCLGYFLLRPFFSSPRITLYDGVILGTLFLCSYGYVMFWLGQFIFSFIGLEKHEAAERENKLEQTL